jgi:hypothetical protein
VRRLTYGHAEPVSPAAMSDYDKQRLVAEVVECEQQLGATTIVPPYLLGSGPDDPAFAVSLELMATTARYMPRTPTPRCCATSSPPSASSAPA